MSRSTIALLALVLCLVGGAAGWWLGVSHGKASATAQQDAQLVKDLRGVFDTQKTLTAEANTASRALRLARTTRQATSQKTTQELTDALTPTADRRADCVLPADGVRLINAARAGSAGQLDGAVPTAGTTPGER